MLASVSSWLLRPDNPILVWLRVGMLVACWARVAAAYRDHPPWAYLRVLLYLAVGLSWSTTLGVLLTWNVVEIESITFLVAPSGYLLYTAVIVFFWTDRRRVLLRRQAIERQVSRAEDLVRAHDRS